MFKEINAAYEILSDEEKRARYDRNGLDGIDDHALDEAAHLRDQARELLQIAVERLGGVF